MLWIINVVGAVLCAAIAPSKHRSAAGWAALGFFLPGIALIALLIAGPGEPPPRQQAPTIVTGGDAPAG